jgi:hypothetical protein
MRKPVPTHRLWSWICTAYTIWISAPEYQHTRYNHLHATEIRSKTQKQHFSVFSIENTHLLTEKYHCLEYRHNHRYEYTPVVEQKLTLPVPVPIIYLFLDNNIISTEPDRNKMADNNLCINNTISSGNSIQRSVLEDVAFDLCFSPGLVTYDYHPNDHPNNPSNDSSNDFQNDLDVIVNVEDKQIFYKIMPRDFSFQLLSQKSIDTVILHKEYNNVFILFTGQEYLENDLFMFKNGEFKDALFCLLTHIKYRQGLEITGKITDLTKKHQKELVQKKRASAQFTSDILSFWKNNPAIISMQDRAEYTVTVTYLIEYTLKICWCYLRFKDNTALFFYGCELKKLCIKHTKLSIQPNQFQCLSIACIKCNPCVLNRFLDKCYTRFKNKTVSALFIWDYTTFSIYHPDSLTRQNRTRLVYPPGRTSVFEIIHVDTLYVHARFLEYYLYRYLLTHNPFKKLPKVVLYPTTIDKVSLYAEMLLKYQEVYDQLVAEDRAKKLPLGASGIGELVVQVALATLYSQRNLQDHYHKNRLFKLAVDLVKTHDWCSQITLMLIQPKQSGIVSEKRVDKFVNSTIERFKTLFPISKIRFVYKHIETRCDAVNTDQQIIINQEYCVDFFDQ